MKIEYNNLYTHFIFTTFLREELILNKNRMRIEKYITGIVNNNDCQLYAIYANPEHIHFLVSRSPRIDEESLAGIIANSSANFINKNKLCKCNFQWQMSCSAFSVSKKDVDHICKYILTQPEHHKTQSFKDEFDSLIKFYQKPINPK
jgi:REP element-mobilizing transposase RayT